MLDLLGIVGKLDDMVKLIQEMNYESDVVAWRTLLYACKAHRNVRESQEQLPENTLVGLVTFDSMVYIHDLGYSECSKVILFHGDREVSSNQTR
ncbi:pentatricopeptide repeat-containing protein At2g36730-like isoform X2 [Arachis duranensis]|uniref:Protein transport protein SEC23 n=1 Tax=Arachis duranensis TaxID=130453 RepID=A0A9C6TDP1_ARADU|nr:pentatricopeptide repeat-containing protein At2g36730-like isoform X2 [Arachis duranensis]